MTVQGDEHKCALTGYHDTVTATPFDTFEDAIRMTNSSKYGLTAAIYTQDSLNANRAVRSIDSGMVCQMQSLARDMTSLMYLLCIGLGEQL